MYDMAFLLCPRGDILSSLSPMLHKNTNQRDARIKTLESKLTVASCNAEALFGAYLERRATREAYEQAERVATTIDDELADILFG